MNNCSYDRKMGKCWQQVTRILMLQSLFVLGAVCTLASSAQLTPSASDTLEVRFRLGLSELDPTFADNSKSLDEFIDRIKKMDDSSLEDVNICIYGGASPEGPNELNRRLGEQRAVSLHKVLEQRLREEGLGRFADRISTVNQGARWGALYSLVSNSNEPWRDEVLKVLRKKDKNAADWTLDPREAELRKMHKGAIWHELNARYLPVLRSSGTAVITREPLVVTDPVTGHCDTLVLRDTVYYVPEPIPYRDGYSYHGRGWALKTNFIPWVTATPNLQAEFTLGHKNKWSIEVEGMMAWWTLSHNAYANEILYGSVELRRWLGNRRVRNTLSGWHVGLAVGGGYYDLEWKSDGYQGEVINSYINIGYQHRFGRYRQWLFDAGIGVGYLYSPYRKYYGSSKFPVGKEEQYDDHLMWQETSRRNWFGATHANISIGYVFGADKPVKYTYEEASPYLYKMRRQAERDSLRAERRAQKAAQRLAKNEAEVASKNLQADMFSMTEDQQKAAKAAEKQAKREQKERIAAEKKAEEAAAKKAKAEARAAKKAQEDQEEAAWKQEQAERKAAAKKEKAEARAAERQAAAAKKEAERKVKEERKAAGKKAAAALKAAKDEEKAFRKAQREARNK